MASRWPLAVPVLRTTRARETQVSTARLEAFSDGVIAILITIMVLELRTPHGTSWDALRPLVPVFLTYVLSFVFLGIYWNNHHHMLQAADHVDGAVLWANLHLLFWLSLVPFVTAWMGENHFASIPTAGYGVVMLMAGVCVHHPAADAAPRPAAIPGSPTRLAATARGSSRCSFTRPRLSWHS